MSINESILAFWLVEEIFDFVSVSLFRVRSAITHFTFLLLSPRSLMAQHVLMSHSTVCVTNFVNMTEFKLPNA